MASTLRVSRHTWRQVSAPPLRAAAGPARGPNRVPPASTSPAAAWPPRLLLAMLLVPLPLRCGDGWWYRWRGSTAYLNTNRLVRMEIAATCREGTGTEGG